MKHKVQIDFAPAYELIISLNAYAQKKYHKNMDLDKNWIEKTTNQLTPEFRSRLADFDFDLTDTMLLLVYHCPAERTAEQYLEWLQSLTQEATIDILSPYLKQVPADLKIRLYPCIQLLSEWNKQYFSKLSSDILEHLTLDARQWEQTYSLLPAPDLFEKVTGGVKLPLNLSDERILLIPHYHLSPINSTYHYRKIYICLYSCDPIPQAPGEPPILLTRLTHCLGDDTRMKLLHLISQEPRTFTELVELIGLSKSTVHHHLIALRGAGLIYLEANGRNSIYSLRKTGIENLYIQLRSHLGI